jgi:hypothetical protein|tara:strand:- start:5450 stop:5638 length:189 start_codon:yes stop_codon:yes gene_type:complete
MLAMDFLLSSSADETRRALLPDLGRVELRLARFLFRHVYVMGSSHHFYVLPPQQMIVTVGGG